MPTIVGKKPEHRVEARWLIALRDNTAALTDNIKAAKTFTDTDEAEEFIKANNLTDDYCSYEI